MLAVLDPRQERAQLAAADAQHDLARLNYDRMNGLLGERVRIRYKAKNHLDFDQMLTPAGPRQVNNRMRVRRFGITVARFEEVIRKLD